MAAPLSNQVEHAGWLWYADAGEQGAGWRRGEYQKRLGREARLAGEAGVIKRHDFVYVFGARGRNDIRISAEKFAKSPTQFVKRPVTIQAMRF